MVHVARKMGGIQKEDSDTPVNMVMLQKPKNMELESLLLLI